MVHPFKTGFYKTWNPPKKVKINIPFILPAISGYRNI